MKVSTNSLNTDFKCVYNKELRNKLTGDLVRRATNVKAIEVKRKEWNSTHKDRTVDSTDTSALLKAVTDAGVDVDAYFGLKSFFDFLEDVYQMNDPDVARYAGKEVEKINLPSELKPLVPAAAVVWGSKQDSYNMKIVNGNYSIKVVNFDDVISSLNVLYQWYFKSPVYEENTIILGAIDTMATLISTKAIGAADGTICTPKVGELGNIPVLVPAFGYTERVATWTLELWIEEWFDRFIDEFLRKKN